MEGWTGLGVSFGNVGDFREVRLQDGWFWADREECFEVTLEGCQLQLVVIGWLSEGVFQAMRL